MHVRCGAARGITGPCRYFGIGLFYTECPVRATRSKVIIGHLLAHGYQMCVVSSSSAYTTLAAVFLHKPECAIPILAQFE